MPPGAMEDPYQHHPPPPPNGRSAGFLIAVPFVVCFSLFGVLNLVGGTALTAMSCRPKMGPKALASLHRIVRNFRIDEHIDPMRVVGIMLLVTGSLLVVIGLALGVTACRSVGEHERKRRRRQLRTSSTLPLYSLVDRRRTSVSLTSSPSFGPSPSVNARCGKKRSLEKTVSPILEEPSGEYESLECERLEVEIHRCSDASSRNASPRCQIFGHAEKSAKSISQEMTPKDGKDFSSSACHASQPTKDVCEIELLADSVLLSKRIPCKETRPENGSNTEVRESSLKASNDVDCHSIHAISVHQTESTSDTVFQSPNFSCQDGTFNASLSTSNCSKMEDSNSQVGSSTNSDIHVYSMEENLSRPNLDITLSRLYCNGSDTLPFASLSSAERTEVHIGHERVNNCTSHDSNHPA